jgi:CRP/FNR family cyclic AMP-dependent transcriptional regulator
MSTRGDPLNRIDPTRLRRVGFFRELTPQDARRLARVGAIRLYRDGELVATEGTRKQRRILYIVLEGRLQYVKRVLAERVAVLLTLLPGEVGGFLTFFNEDPSPVSVRSLGRTRVFEIGRRELQSLMEEQPALAAKLLVSLLRATTSRLEGIMTRLAATSAWVLELEHHVHAIPLEAMGKGREPRGRPGP